MVSLIKCLFGYHQWVYYFTPFYTFPYSGIRLGIDDRVCFKCGKH